MFKKKRIVLLALVLFFGAICFGSVAIAQVCEGDFNCNGNVALDDLLIFLDDIGRSDCPPCPPQAPVEKTGQTTCYDSAGNTISCAGTGQDGDLQKGVTWPTPRFTDNDDGTVTDNLTGLIWLQNANCAEMTKTWADALTYCNGLASGSCELDDGSVAGDWRLPNVKELQSLIDFSQYFPALPSGHPFTNVQSAGYWSSTTLYFFKSSAWNVQMYNGNVNAGDKVDSNNRYVWPVRSGN